MVCRKKDTSLPNSSCTRRQLYAPEIFRKWRYGLVCVCVCVCVSISDEEQIFPISLNTLLNRIQSCPIFCLGEGKKGANFATGYPYFKASVMSLPRPLLFTTRNKPQAPISTLIDHAGHRNFRLQFGWSSRYEGMSSRGACYKAGE